MAAMHPDVVARLSRLKGADSEAVFDAVLALAKMYGSESCPPAWPLREKHVLDRLVGLLFQPYKSSLPDAVRRGASWLLTLAASDVRAKDGDALLEGLVSASALCNKEESLSIARVEACVAQDLSPLVVGHPTVAMGYLFWVRAVLDHPQFVRSLGYFSAVQAMSRLVGRIGRAHRLQAAHAFAILQLIVEAPKPDSVSDAQHVDLWKTALDGMIDLVREGFVQPVVTFVRSVQNRLDLSLLRHFLKSTMLLACAPGAGPWARDESFHRALELILTSEKVRRYCAGARAGGCGLMRSLCRASWLPRAAGLNSSGW